jgi:hypothetical protein
MGLLAAAVVCAAMPIFSQTTTPPVQVYVGYAENERIPIYFPDPWVGSPNTITLGTYPGYAWDGGAILLYNSGTTPVTLSKGVTVSGFASGTTFQLWDSYLPVTIQPGWRVIIAQNAALDGPSLSSPYGTAPCIANDDGGTLCFSNFDTSDTPTGSAPTAVTPAIHLTLNGVAYTFTDTAQVLNTGGFDYGTQLLINESQQWRPVGTTGPDLPAGTGVPAPPIPAFDVTTYHYNAQRTGVNTQESVLTPSQVGSSAFTKLNTVNFNGHVDAQALVISASTWSSWGYATTYPHDVVYIATSNNDVFAIDGVTGAILKQRNFGTPVPQSSLPLNCGNNGSTVGISSTPVIDPANKVMYFISFNLVSNAPVYFVHKINLLDLSDNVAATPVSAESTLSDGKTQVALVAAYQRQRPGLLLSGGNLYAGFGSFCDVDTNISRGWIVGWTAASLSPLPSAALMDSATNAQVGAGLSGVAGGYTIDFNSSIWQSGFALSADSAGNVYVQTGNSDGSTVANFPDSVVKVSSTLASVEDYFTPLNFKALDLAEMERGSSGVMVVPDQPNGNQFAVAHGKDGRLFLLNRNNLGKLSTTSQDVPPFVTTGGCWCGPDYFVGSDGAPRIVSNGGVNVQTWFLPGSQSGNLTSEATGVSLPSPGNWDPGFMSSVSANGTQPNSAVIWSVSRAQNGRIFLQALDGTAGAGWTGSAQPGGGAVVDKAGNIWSFGSATRTAGEHSVVLNGTVVPGAYAVKLVIGNDGNAYQLNAFNQWWVPSGSSFTQLSAAPKARPASLTGTTITPASGGAVTDITGNVWSFGPNTRNPGEYSVLVNGVPTIAFALKVVIDTNGKAWHYNYYGQWFTGDGMNWTEQSGPPSLLLKSWIGDTISASTGGSLTDSAGNVWSFGNISRNPGENNVLLNGKPTNGAFAVRLFIGTNGAVWQFNYYAQWWTGDGTNWTMASSTPNFFTPRIGSWATPAASGELRELQLVDTGAWTVTSNANVVPVVANGRVYVPSDNALTIWGIE